MSSEPSDLEFAWDELLEYVVAGRIVPIVGPGLLRARTEGNTTRLDQLISSRLAEQLKRRAGHFPATLVSPDESAAHVAGRWLAQGGVPGELSNAIRMVLRSLADLPPPRPLQQLAEISDFDLFVTLTWDGMLERALRGARSPSESVVVHNYSLRRPLGGSTQGHGQSRLVYLFGQASLLDDFAITEEDLLEYAHSVVSQPVDNRVPTVLDEVRQRNLLIVGADLPRWLSRFFLRFAKRYRLWTTRGERLVDFIADHSIEEDVALTEFLKTFSNRHVLFPMDPVDFVDELHRRWSAHRALAPSATGALGGAATDSSTPSIFLSYAREDAEFVLLLKKELEQAALDVWVDSDELSAGDAFEAKIKSAVRNAALFVPVVSRAGEDTKNRFFRKEWGWAASVIGERRADMKYVCPIALDNVPESSAWIPEEFRELHWVRADRHQVPLAFVVQLRDAYREHQRRRVR